MKIIGHRGARGLAPENTIEAIQEALTHRVDMIEIDVRVTKDGVPVLHHNKKLPNGASVSRSTFAELKELEPRLATLEEAIKIINKRVPLYIEVKRTSAADKVAEVLKKLLRSGWQPQDFSLASFSHRTLAQLHKALPELETIVLESFSGLVATWRARQLDTQFIVINQLWLYGAFVRMMKKRGWKLGAYTLNDIAKARRWEKDGLYAVVTDYPDRFKQKTNPQEQNRQH